ncbi:TPA: arginine ABC transporter permease ArtM, partial [Vibrio cholerae]
MKEQHLWQLLEGLGTSLQLTAASLLVGCILSLLMTVSLVMRTPVVHW